MNDEGYVEIPFPAGGLDESGAIHRQSPPTTPKCQNVRSWEPKGGRNRGGQRSGLTKACPVQINSSNSIQEINAVTSAGSGPLGSGRIYIHSTDPCWIIDQQGDPVFRHGQSGASGATNGQACFDTEDNLYQTSVGETTTPYAPLAVRKFDPEGKLLWTTILFNSDTTSLRQTLGLGIAGDILYVCGVVTQSGSNVYIWRLDPRTGGILDTGTYNSWLNSTLQTWKRTGSIINDYNRQFAVGLTHLAIACPVNDSDASKLMVLVRSSGSVSGTATLVSSPGNIMSVEDVDVDESGNVYVCFSATLGGSGQSNRLSKYSSAGVAAWTISGAFCTGVTWDPVYQLLYVAGKTINAAAGNAYAVSATDGTNVVAATIGTNAYLEFVRADGRGGYWFGVAIVGADLFYLVDSTLATVSVSKAIPNCSSYWSAASNGRDTTKGSAGSQRTTRLVAVAKGTVKGFDRQGTIRVVSGSSLLALTAPTVFSAPNSGVLYFVDNGTNYAKLTLSTMTAATWTATSGTLPTDSSSNKARLIETWRGRTLLSGLPGDAHNFFGSATVNPLDYNYGPATPLATSAFAGNLAECGKCADIINGMVPWSDDICTFGCDHSMWDLAGDPNDGGRFKKASDTIGMAWGRAWCIGPDGVIYWFGSRGSVFRRFPGEPIDPQKSRISTAIDERLQKIDLERHRIRLAWDDRQQGLHVFVTPLDPKTAATHWFWDSRNGGWWLDSFANKNHNPKTLFVYDGDDPNDRAVLLGSWDGYVRFLDVTADDDDGEAIDSYVYIGPIQGKANEGIMLKSLDGALDEDSGPVDWSLHVGETEQVAVAASAAVSGTLKAGRFRSQPCRRRGTAIFLRLGNDALNSTWALEWLAGAIAGKGKISQRAFP